MSKDELIKKLKELAEAERDEEQDHFEADALLLEFIGDDEVKKAFEAIRKWYS